MGRVVGRFCWEIILSHQCGTGKVFTASTADDALEITARRSQILFAHIENSASTTVWEIYDGPKNTGTKVALLSTGSVSLNNNPYIQVNNGFSVKLVGPGSAKLTLTYT